jgi:AcrR family transcriptional regulator
MILNTAAKLATVEGLDGLSIGRLAEHIGMSKSGLFAHFGSKEELQLATIETAKQIFEDEVVVPAADIEDPVEHLKALCDGYLEHMRRKTFPGGCFFAAAAAEFDTHPGPVRERVAQMPAQWMAGLVGLVAEAQRQGLIDPEEDAVQTGFELDAYLAMANMNFVLYDDPVALERAERAVRKHLERISVPAARTTMTKTPAEAR